MRSHMKLFKLIKLTLLIFSLSLILFSSPALAQYFTITKFHSDITIQNDSSFTVRETIEVKFHRSRHGIYREIPFKYRDEFGKTVTTPTTILSVTDGSGKSWKYQVKKTGSIINIRIGDPKRFVSGNQTYVITYEVENAILFLNDHDELYWNVTGNYWKADIVNASADVSLSTKEKRKNLWDIGYVGHSGSTEEAGHETYENGGEIFAKRSFNPGEGLTIAFGWGKGLFSPPPSWKKFFWLINFQR